uniref:two-partner secretion domain-containing protein n=1 Tax=Polaromonas sp. TaxID=1869339 RepID=UPI002FCBB8FD
MNKNLHRIIFSQARGQRMVVQETAASSGKANGATEGQRPGGLDDAASTGYARLGRLAFAVLCLAGAPLHLMSAAQAQIVADPSAPGNQRPTVLNTANGVPQVNIQTPSAAGVSRNTYSRFDVNRPGAILNNSRTNAQTQLGGWVQGNPWLASGPARVILNEVNSSNPSQLRGFVEVAGSRAEVIIANPAGVNIDGGGFINASRATITTGVPSMTGGNLDGFLVQRGLVTINGAGLDASQTDYTSILARAVQVNAPVWANELKLTTGANQISADQTQAAPIAGAGPAPAFALDVAQLGGMYAGKIHLISTEAGVGVRNSGQLSAGTGQLTLSADGWLRNSGTVNGATGVTLSASAGIDNSGTVYSQGDASLATRGDVANSGVIAAQGNVTATALGASSQVSSTTGSIWAAGLRPDGSVSASGNLNVQATQNLALHGRSVSGGDQSHAAAHLDLSGSQLSARDLNLAATAGDVNASNASLAADQTLTVSARQNLRTDGARVSGNQLNFSAQSLSNAGGEIVQTGLGDMAINLAGDLNNAQGRIAANAQNLTLAAQTLTNTTGKIEHAGTGQLAITANTLSGTSGLIQSNHALNLNAGSATLDAARVVAAQLAIHSSTLSNRGGEIIQSGTGNASITATTSLDNSSGVIAGYGNITLTTGKLKNQGGVIQAAGGAGLTINASGTLDNSALGKISADGAALLTAQNIDNSRGQISAGTTLTASATQGINNTQGLLASNGQNTLMASTIDNTRGTISSVQGGLSLGTTGGAIDNTQGRIEAALDVHTASNGLTNASGVMTGQAVSIDSRSQTFNNTGGTLSARAALDVQSGSLLNDAGLIQANALLTINTHGQLLANTNSGASKGILGQGTLALATGDLNNQAGFIGARGGITANSAVISNTQNGIMTSEAAMVLNATRFNNQGGQLQALGDVSVNVGTGEVVNTQGLMRSGNTLTVAASNIGNDNTQASSQGLEGKSVALAANHVSNAQGAIRADQSVQIVGTGSLNNTQGLVSSGHTVDVRDSHAASNPAAKTQSITNTQGTLIAGQALNIDSGSLSGDGRVLSQGDLSVTLNGDFTHTGEFTANGTASLNIRGDLTNHAKLLAGNTINVTAANINNTATGEISAANTNVTATGTLTNRGLIDGTQTRLKATTVNNIGTGRIFGTELAIAATTLNNDAENGQAAVIAARSRLDIGAQTLNNREGALLFSAGDMAIGGSLDINWRATGQAQTVNNNSATIEALGGLGIATGQLSNTNEHFSYTVVPSGSVGKTDYITPQGVYSDADVAWLGAERIEVSFFGGPSMTVVMREKIVPSSSPYANPRFKAYYEGPPAYKAPYSYETGGGDAPQTVNVAAAYNYTADSPIWADFGVAAPTQSYVTAPQPWADLQAKLDVFKPQVTASLVGYDVYRSYTETSYTATTLASKPGQILSGGAMTLAASDALVNDKSKIIAGGALSVTGRSIDNRTASVSAPSQRSGTAYSWGVIGQDCDWAFGCDDVYGWQTSAYAQEIPKTVTLALAQSQGNTAPPRVGASVPASPLAPGIGQSAAGAGSPGVQLGQAQSVGTITQIAAINRNTPGALPSVIRTTVPNTAIPGNSLFRVNPAPSSRYLVETDPRFASYKTWLSSDYLLSALRLDPATLQKRLGDGFYEQRLINEQVAQLTGQRFLQGFASDEAQYRALIDSGVTVARQWSLRPGIALSAAQMAQLTSDIVWLVEREVSLDYGSIQKVLVPQVYVAVKPGDLKSDGSLLAGQSVKLNLSGDLANSGTIAGRTIVALNADNVHNLAGRIQGQDVTVAAKTDLNNIGGVIQADKRLLATAGRDLNVVSTTQSARSSAGAGVYDYTGLDRMAGLYVT